MLTPHHLPLHFTAISLKQKNLIIFILLFMSMIHLLALLTPKGMSLSTKEVSNDHHEINWTKNSCNLETLPKPRSTKRQHHQQQQQPEHLKCPRCESTNTKFCYYNNYNKTQPRHFCKACKRHWTKGGTLRNVPEGGGRKNKRLKRPNATTNANASITPTSQKILPPGGRIQKGPSNIKTTVTKPTGNEWSSTGPQTFSIDMQVGSNDPTWDFNGCFMSSTFQAPQNPSLGFGSSSLSSFDAIPTSVPSSLSSLNGYDEVGEKVDMLATQEDSTITSIFPRCGSSTIGSQPWQGTSSTNSFIDLPSYWNWNMDVDTMVLADLNIPWDDSEFYNP